MYIQRSVEKFHFFGQLFSPAKPDLFSGSSSICWIREIEIKWGDNNRQEERATKHEWEQQQQLQQPGAIREGSPRMWKHFNFEVEFEDTRVVFAPSSITLAFLSHPPSPPIRRRRCFGWLCVIATYMLEDGVLLLLLRGNINCQVVAAAAAAVPFSQFSLVSPWTLNPAQALYLSAA